MEKVNSRYKKTICFNGNYHSNLRRQNKVPYGWGCQREKYKVRMKRKMEPVGIGPCTVWEDICSKNLLENPNEQESGQISSTFWGDYLLHCRKLTLVRQKWKEEDC